MIPGLGRSPGGGNGNPLQHSCLENAMDRQAWWSMGLQRVGHNGAHTHKMNFTCSLVIQKPKRKGRERMKTSIFKNTLPKRPDSGNTSEEQLHAAKSRSFVTPLPSLGHHSDNRIHPLRFLWGWGGSGQNPKALHHPVWVLVFSPLERLHSSFVNWSSDSQT